MIDSTSGSVSQVYCTIPLAVGIEPPVLPESKWSGTILGVERLAAAATRGQVPAWPPGLNTAEFPESRNPIQAAEMETE